MGSFTEGRLQQTGVQTGTDSGLQGLGRIGVMLHRWRTRKVLLTLTDDELRDVGLSWAQARAEAAKPFWKP